MTKDERMIAAAPIWYWNMILLLDWQQIYRDEAGLAVLYYIAQIVNQWLDETRVIGNPAAERAVRVTYRLMSRWARFSELKFEAAEQVGPLWFLHKTHVRLKGLLKGIK